MRATKQKSFWELSRIIIPALAALLLFVFSSFYLFLPRFEKSLFEDRKMMIRELVQSSWHMIQMLDQEVGKGKSSLKDAQKVAIEHLREMRYGEENKDYFWINDFSPTLIMHPYRPDMEGTDLSDYTDPAGTRLFMDFVKKVKEEKQGYVPYMWQWKDDPSRIVPKLSFVKEYKPWGWIIGTGMYLEDVEAEIASMTEQLVAASILILLSVSLIAWYQIHQALKALRLRQQAEDELLAYKDQLEKKVISRTEELSNANTVLQKSEERFRCLSEASFEGICIIEGGTIVEVNDAMMIMFGYDSSEFTGMAAIETVAPICQKEVEEKISSGYGKPYDTFCRRKDGSVFPVEAHGRSFLSGGRQMRITAIRDISRRKQAEEEREKLIAELQKALGEIKTLSGFLPICSACKKIRDDQGYWKQIESYIMDHSEAAFSHGVCPDCAQKLYPEIVDENGDL